MHREISVSVKPLSSRPKTTATGPARGAGLRAGLRAVWAGSGAAVAGPRAVGAGSGSVGAGLLTDCGVRSGRR